ncbi:MAG: C40 family peptidase [Ruminococcus sp.]|nr:C40 family peptidase [Ruminococcus sp.]
MKQERKLARTSLSAAMAVIISLSTMSYASADSSIADMVTGDTRSSIALSSESAYESIKDAKITGIKKKYRYSGSAVKPEITLKYKSKTLSEGDDYTLTYKNNNAPGQASVTVKGAGNFRGSVTKKFIILPARAEIKSAKSAKASTATLKWKKVKGADGYRIACSTTKSFKKVRYITVKGKSKLTIKKLTGGKRYYFKVQAYKTVNGKKRYGALSKRKSVKIALTKAQKTALLQKKVCDYGRSMKGGSYVWGGSSFKATDCSGLTMQCYAQVGIELPHNAAAQASYGKPVTLGAMKAGDLIIMNYGSHAALYLGGGEFVHATTPERGITIEPVSKLDYYHVDTVRRLLG